MNNGFEMQDLNIYKALPFISYDTASFFNNTITLACCELQPHNRANWEKKNTGEGGWESVCGSIAETNEKVRKVVEAEKVMKVTKSADTTYKE